MSKKITAKMNRALLGYDDISLFVSLVDIPVGFDNLFAFIFVHTARCIRIALGVETP
jgi:hypothetical protein